MMKPALNLRVLALAALLAAGCGSARAALFEDDEARKAILELRNRVGQLERTNTEQASALRDEIQQLRRQLVDMNNQLELMRGEEAKLRGQNEQLARDVAELQRRQKDVSQGIDERLRKFEPQQVTVDGKSFNADPDEKRLYDEALAPMRNGDFANAANLLSAFLQRYPRSGYVDSARFWLGNALYGKRQYKEAIASFRAFVSGAPQHPRAPEGLLAIANCQIEMKDTKGAKATLSELLKSYGQSEAAQAAKERLAALK
jgi:tol-pal system protein YbgF